jgi:hypothetical protein
MTISHELEMPTTEPLTCSLHPIFFGGIKSGTFSQNSKNQNPGKWAPKSLI